MGMFSEFKDFIAKGNVMDLAVGVIIGAAFGKIVDSLVKDLIMPLVSAVFGSSDFTNLYIKLGEVPAGVADNYEALNKAGVPVFAYGSFLTVLINFLILAFVIFMMVKQLNKIKKADAAASAVEAEDTVLLREIRDALKKK